MEEPHIVIDTNVWVAGRRSRRGASWQLLALIDTGRYHMHLSVPLVFEYEDVFLRHHREMHLTKPQARALVDDICELGIQHEVFYRWRGFSRDPDDDHVLELAVAAGADAIITYNKQDFAEAGTFGVAVLNAYEFINQLD